MRLKDVLIAVSRRALIPTMVLVLLSAVGCEKKANPVDVEISQAGQSLRRNQVLVQQNMDDSITAERAKQLASRHLTLKQVNWGEPVAVRDDEDNYYVSYQTPERELRLIGARMLVVDKQTGVVSVQKRR